MKRALALTPALLAGCSGPLSTLQPGGPVAGHIALLWWVMLLGAAGLTLMVVMLVALGFRGPREVQARVWTHGLGIWFSLVVLSGTLAVGLWVGERILPRDDGAVVVEAHAVQWSWHFTHEDAAGNRVGSVDVLHIPAGVPVDVLITSEDVIHSFWVPQLAGKMDAIPGRTNRARIIADAPGRYAGLCAEFCGLHHAGMRFDVQAHADWPPAPDEDVPDEDAPDEDAPEEDTPDE